VEHIILSEKERAIGLLKNQRCENCSWIKTTYGSIKEDYCIFHDASILNTKIFCKFWSNTDDGYFIKILKTKEEVVDFLKNGMDVPLGSIILPLRGIQIYGMHENIIFENKYEPGLSGRGTIHITYSGL
jgi:hypothetical protein